MNETEKWFWMIAYCKKNGLHPEEASNWELAEKALGEELKKCLLE